MTKDLSAAHDTWSTLRDQFRQSTTTVDILPPGEAPVALSTLSVASASWFGAVLANTGGMLIDNGWTRVLGGDGARTSMPGILRANGFSAGSHVYQRCSPDLVVGYDVLGGVFVLNGSRSVTGGQPGSISYYTPDNLDWYHLGLHYGAWIRFLLSDQGAKFFPRWPGWENETDALRPDQGLAMYPFPWSQEANEHPAATSRRAVPIWEVLGTQHEAAEQFGCHLPPRVEFDR